MIVSRSMPLIAPSILSANFARLGEDIATLEAAGATLLHVDVMDGHFVPNLTLGPQVVKSIRKVTRMTLDVHLMITDPDTYAPMFIDAGADQVSVHYEAARHLDRTLHLIKDKGAKAGVVLNPATPVAVLEDVLDITDFVLVMSVNPGFEGQQFIPHSVHKIRQLAEIRRERNLGYRIQIDGGVMVDNVERIVQAGCDWLVAGSHIFHSADPAATFKKMQQIADGATSIRV